MKTGVKTDTSYSPVMEQVSEVRRIDGRYLIDSILSAFYLEKGLLFTIRKLLIKPGEAMREFLFTHNRERYTKPLGFLILSSSIAAIIAFSYSDNQKAFIDGLNQGFEEGRSAQQEEITAEADGSVPEGEGDSSKADNKAKKEKEVIKKFQVASEYYFQNFNLFLILFVPFSAFFCFAFFRKDKWYFTEHMVSNAYLVSVQNVVSIPFFIIGRLYPLVTVIYVFIMIGYQVYFYNRVYKGGRGFAGILRITSVIVLASVFYSLWLSLMLAAVILYPEA
jgi:hypothetical protein